MNITKVLTIIVFIVISSSAYTNCTDHKIFVHTMKQQVDGISTKENKKTGNVCKKSFRRSFKTMLTSKEYRNSS